MELAVSRAIDANVRTKDLGGESSTSQMGDAVIKELAEAFQAVSVT